MDKEKEQFILTTEFVKQDFELEEKAAPPTEEDLLMLLADRIAYMIEYKMEYLMSLMYRLDIDERKVDAALQPDAVDPPPIGLAKIVLARQKQRAYTKQFYKQQDLENLDGLDY